MVVKAGNSLVEPFKLIGKDMGYYALRGLASLALIFVALTVFGIIVGVTTVGTLATMGITGFDIQITDFDELGQIIAGLAGMAILLLVLVIIVMIFNYSVMLGMVRDYTASIMEGKKQYKLFAGLGITITYLIAAFLLFFIPAAIIGFITSLLGTLGAVLGVIAMLAYGIFMLQFVILPAVAAYRNENAFRAIGTNWNILANQRWNVIGAALLLLLAMIPVGFVSIIIGMIPFLGGLVLLALNFFITLYINLWVANVYKQAVEK